MKAYVWRHREIVKLEVEDENEYEELEDCVPIVLVDDEWNEVMPGREGGTLAQQIVRMRESLMLATAPRPEPVTTEITTPSGNVLRSTILPPDPYAQYRGDAISLNRMYEALRTLRDGIAVQREMVVRS